VGTTIAGMVVHTVDATKNKAKASRSAHFASVAGQLMRVVRGFVDSVVSHWCRPTAGSAMRWWRLGQNSVLSVGVPKG